MPWFLLCLFVGSAIVAGYFAWRKWVAPWRKISELVEAIAETKRPKTFLVGGGAMPRRVGLILEEIFTRQQQLAQQVTEGASGTETILAAMQDGLLVVDAARHITLANETFEEFLNFEKLHWAHRCSTPFATRPSIKSSPKP